MDKDERIALSKIITYLEKTLLDNLPDSDGDPCNCNDTEYTYKVVHEGNLFNEFTEYCLVCGGLVEN